MSLKFEIRQVVDPTKEDLDVGAELLANAFDAADHEHKLNRIFFGCESQELHVNFQRATLIAVAKSGTLYYAYDDRNEVIGVAGWYQPGVELFSDKEQGEGKGGFDEFFPSLSPQISNWWLNIYLPKFNDQINSALDANFKLENWHLMVLGVHPGKMHKGVGTALVRIGEERAKADKKWVIIEAMEDSNAEIFYKGKLGYSVKPSGPPEHPEYRTYDDYEGNYAFNMWIFLKDFS